MAALIDWDKLRTFLAVHRAGSLTAGARSLRLDQTTVSRRVEALETELGAKLFERTRSGLRATAMASELFPLVERMELEALRVERKATGSDTRSRGTVKVSATEAFATRLLFPRLSSFQARHPGIELELLVTNEVVSLERGEAHLAVRVVAPKEQSVVARRSGTLGIALYAARSYLQRLGTPQPKDGFRGHLVLGYRGSAERWPEARWLSTHAPHAAVQVRQDSLLGLLAATQAGLGLALLPCFLADEDPALQRVLDPRPELARGVWLVAHRDVVRNPLVRATLAFIGDLLKHEGTRLEGQRA